MQNTYQDLITDIQSKNPEIHQKLEGGKKFKLVTDFKPAGDQPEAIKQLVKGANKEELNHLLTNYTQLVINLIVKNWPKCFPDMKSKQIRHQYSKQFEAGVKAFTGPLVCETESTLEVLKLNEVQDFWNTLILGH